MTCKRHQCTYGSGNRKGLLGTYVEPDKLRHTKTSESGRLEADECILEVITCALSVV